MLDLDHVKKLSHGWLAAIAGAAAAGATIVPAHRVLAAVGFGGAMLFIALKLTPCCDGCAQGAGCGGEAASSSTPATTPTTPSTTIAEGEPVSPAALFSRTAIVNSAGKACA